MKIYKKKNPIDQKFLDQLTIDKDFIDYKGGTGAPPGKVITYTVKYKNEEIAHAFYRMPQSTDYFRGHYIIEVDVYEDEHKHKGIATWLYNYIENDLNIKLEPSKWGRTPDGIQFWNNRFKRLKKNPTNQELLNRLRIKEIDSYRSLTYLVYLDYIPTIRESRIIKPIGELIYSKLNSTVIYNWVDEKYQHNGIATYLHDLIEKQFDIKLNPSNNLLPEGKLFWKNRLKIKN